MRTLARGATRRLPSLFYTDIHKQCLRLFYPPRDSALPPTHIHIYIHLIHMSSAAASADTAAPVSFLDALRQRYGATADDHNSVLVQDKKWQFVGSEKAAKRQSQYDRLTLVVLRNCGITCAMTTDETRDGNHDNALKDANMARLEELDLSENPRLTLWEVGNLLPYLPRLATLQLCDIPALLSPALTSPPVLALPTGASSAAAITAAPPLLISTHLLKLVLNNTGFTSLAQLRALIAVPALRELHLDSNKLTSLDLVTATEAASGAAAGAAAAAICFPRVTTLSLAHNELSDWRAISAAISQAFPALTELFLADNRLQDLILSDDLVAHAAAGVAWTAAEEREMQPYAYLRPLTLLGVNDNPTLAHPATVDAVRVLCPRLTTFRITYRTLLPAWNETNSRMYVVAALPTISLLNRGTVRAKERLDSELLYVQRGLQQRMRDAETAETAAAATQQGDTPQPHTAAVPHVPYPLVDVLRERHKDVVLSMQREGDTATTTGAGHVMLNVTLHFVNGYAAATATATDSPLSTQTQKLPSSLTVAKLKALMQKVFQVRPVNQRLSYRSGDHGVLETQTPLDNEQETLGYYGVPDGAIIYVEDASLRD
ncbi:hypothetical protein ABB37_09867 [Leptomonas pyrrhocoris]|uniref:Ubiquitin-like domain-containing protein n=1 Tax=Leptomonas pyrrhocoris TaxID=157538 RepID=A0A0M9FPN6_LEPPY|nr:hypothetical protein ABB37_09867 [Leptomonas pyrrhocoris]KPA73423.1 hypothetical protein ABB37_09867 [Leptomonas pyrrhocoris]|eukprot:XP_015651862.1 hypothetical protein ABB37_09867 [Leptomonas pyrrhocoris]